MTDQERLFDDVQPQEQYEAPAESQEQELSQGENQEQYEEPQEQEQPQQRDWKAEAIKAQTRLEMMERQREQPQVPQPAQPQQPSEAEQLRKEIEEKKAAMPALDDKNPQSFWQREKAKEEISGLQEKLYDARLRQQENVLLEQQVGTQVQQFKQQHSQRPEFRAVEQQFNQAVQQLQPHLRGNQTMLDMIRKNLEYDYMQQNRNQRKAPPQAPDGSYRPQAQANQNPGKAKWKSAEDQRVGEYYMQRGIISGPEEFYSPKYNEKTPETNDNGIPIYDVPNTKRGWRR